MRIRLTPSARLQFLTAVAFIQRDNPAAAKRFRNRAERVLKRLERFPDSGKLLAEFPELPFREIVVSPYRFFYRVKSKTVWVVAVWHGAQLPRSPTG